MRENGFELTEQESPQIKSLIQHWVSILPLAPKRSRLTKKVTKQKSAQTATHSGVIDPLINPRGKLMIVTDRVNTPTIQRLIAR